MFQKTKECFICCDISGKSKNEQIFDMMYGNNAIILNYPIISLSSAFSCDCKNMFAHNTCISKLNKCPQCRKNIKPNVFYIPSQKEKIWLIILLCFVLFCVCVFIIMGINCDKSIKNKAHFCKNIRPEYCVLLYVFFMISLYFIKWLEYRWLFNIIGMKSIK
jgi:hypothetical protein